MTQFIISFLFLLCSLSGFTQEKKVYNPTTDAQKEINAAITKAKITKKHVLIIAGGNWCVWCLRFDKFVKTTPYIDTIVQANYEVVHLNYSKENPNKKIFAKYGFPDRFGFPVFIILDEKGNRIHTQDTSYLENNTGTGYDKVKVSSFLEQWRYIALHPISY